MHITNENNIFSIKNNDKERYLEIINKNVLRVYYKKNSSRLVSLNTTHENVSLSLQDNLITLGKYSIDFDENLNIEIKDTNNVVFREYKEEYVCKKNDCEIASQINIDLFSKSYVYGLGDKAKFLNHYGYEFISYNTDDPTAHNEQYRSLYKSINYLLVNHDDKYFGIFYPSTFKTFFNIGKDISSLLYIASYKGEHDFFIILGDTPEEITKAYSSLVGHPLMATLKMLGNQQSRWSYMSAEEVKDIANKYRQNKLPLDFIHLDIDYMDHYKDFSFNKETFPSLKGLAEELAKQGVGLVSILDAGVKEEEGYDIYDYLVKNNLALTYENEVYVNEVWPGRSIFPDFARKETQLYWKECTKNWLNTTGIRGMWCDMNEPASFKGPLPDLVEGKVDGETIYHEEFHNIYGEKMVKGVAEAFKELNRRPYVITRACFGTASQYSICWNGDNQSLWGHLEASLPQVCSMSISNFPLDGVDVGGFSCDTTDELLTRWIEANIFSPFLRNHSAQGTKYQEPWMFSPTCLDTYREMLNLRYKFIPYMYDLSSKANREGTPIVRPLFYNYPFDPKCKEINDEIMIGDNLLLTPITKQGAVARAIYLPEGTWINYFTKEEYQGNNEYLLHLEINEVGLFVKKGSVIPMYKDLQFIEKDQIDTLYFDATYGNGEYINYEDDGETLNYLDGEFNIYKVCVNNEEVTIDTLHHGYNSPYKKIVVITSTKTVEKSL